MFCKILLPTIFNVYKININLLFPVIIFFFKGNYLFFFACIFVIKLSFKIINNKYFFYLNKKKLFFQKKKINLKRIVWIKKIKSAKVLNKKSVKNNIIGNRFLLELSSNFFFLLENSFSFWAWIFFFKKSVEKKNFKVKFKKKNTLSKNSMVLLKKKKIYFFKNFNYFFSSKFEYYLKNKIFVRFSLKILKNNFKFINSNAQNCSSFCYLWLFYFYSKYKNLFVSKRLNKKKYWVTAKIMIARKLKFKFKNARKVKFKIKKKLTRFKFKKHLPSKLIFYYFKCRQLSKKKKLVTLFKNARMKKKIKARKLFSWKFFFFFNKYTTSLRKSAIHIKLLLRFKFKKKILFANIKKKQKKKVEIVIEVKPKYKLFSKKPQNAVIVKIKPKLRKLHKIKRKVKFNFIKKIKIIKKKIKAKTKLTFLKNDFFMRKLYSDFSYWYYYDGRSILETTPHYEVFDLSIARPRVLWALDFFYMIDLSLSLLISSELFQFLNLVKVKHTFMRTSSTKKHFKNKLFLRFKIKYKNKNNYRIFKFVHKSNAHTFKINKTKNIKFFTTQGNNFKLSFDGFLYSFCSFFENFTHNYLAINIKVAKASFLNKFDFHKDILVILKKSISISFFNFKFLNVIDVNNSNSIAAQFAFQEDVKTKIVDFINFDKSLFLANDDTPEIFFNRVKFKPGYKIYWKKARIELKLFLNLKNKYQKKLTRYIVTLKKYSNDKIFNVNKCSLLKISLYSNFFISNEICRNFIDSGVIFVNGHVCFNTNYQIFANDFVQMLIFLKFYIAYKFLKNLHINRSNKLKFKLKKEKNQYLSKLDKNIKRSYPRWLLFNKSFVNDVAKFLEIDFFSLSIFVLYEPFLIEDFEINDFFGFNSNVLNMYNWKYIT